MPSRFTVSILVPIFGLTNPIIKQAKANRTTTNFKIGLKADFSGLSFLINSKSPNSRCFFRFQYCTYKNSIAKTGMAIKKYK